MNALMGLLSAGVVLSLAAISLGYGVSPSDQQTQPQTAECRVACLYMGYDDGSFDGTRCLCIDRHDYERAVKRKKLVLPHRRKT